MFARHADRTTADSYRLQLGRILDVFVSKLSFMKSQIPKLLAAGQRLPHLVVALTKWCPLSGHEHTCGLCKAQGCLATNSLQHVTSPANFCTVSLQLSAEQRDAGLPEGHQLSMRMHHGSPLCMESLPMKSVPCCFVLVCCCVDTFASQCHTCPSLCCSQERGRGAQSTEGRRCVQRPATAATAAAAA